MVKEPGAVSPTPWHQDLNYWPVEGKQICSAWIAFDHVDRANGGMEFVAGSHEAGHRYQPFDFRQTDAVETDEFEPLPDVDARRADLRILTWDLAPGDAVVFSALTLHGAAGNATGDRRRRALSIRYAGDDARFTRRKKMIRLLRDPGLEVGDRLDCDLFRSPGPGTPRRADTPRPLRGPVRGSDPSRPRPGGVPPSPGVASPSPVPWRTHPGVSRLGRMLDARRRASG